MKLIKVEAEGFKSFADRITLNFDGGVVGVVGPNGSGKSNINDAIKWVLGEQSSKALRGDSMQDVIFAGSKTVKEMDKAEVILTFDNSDGVVSIPHKVFTISRVLHRGKGGNEYYINGELARYKDIKEIAMESGISKSSLAIISQGTISDIAEASPETRRGIIEEAAGTSIYKSKKEESLSKLERTEEALERVRTVIEELDKQLKPLQKKAEKAKIYIEKSDALKSIEVGLLVEDLTYYGQQLDILSRELQDVQENKNDYESQIQNLESSIGQTTNFKHELEMEVQKLSRDLEAINSKLQEIEIRETKEAERRKMIINGEVSASSEEQIQNIKTQLSNLNTKISNYRSFEEKTKNEIETRKINNFQLEKQISTLKNSLGIENDKINRARSNIALLKEQKDKRTNLFKGTKNIIENAHLFKGYKGTVANLMKIEKEFIPVIEAILKNTLQHVVVDTPETAVKAIEFLKNNRAGQATFIPLSSIQPREMRYDHFTVLKSQKGFVGLASSLVEFEPEFQKVNEFLLGNTIVAQTIEDANRLSKLMGLKYLTASLDGDIIRVGGVMSGGAKQEANNLLGIDEKILELESIIPGLQKNIDESNKKIKELENEKSNSLSIVSELTTEMSNVHAKRISAQDEFSALRMKYESLTKETLDIKEDESSKETLELLEAQKIALNANIRAKADRVVNLGNELSILLTKKQELDRLLRELNSNFASKMNDRNKAEFQVSASQKRLSEHYQMTLDMAKENYKLEMEIEKAREFVKNLRNEIKELGNVDLDSIEQVKEVETRFNDLSSSKDELEEAKNLILEAISEMDKIIVNRIKDTVQIVNDEFRKVFQSMFGGGDAQIQYTDPENILETGIDIIAQPPGKSVKNLKLFSGGEKAIIAISLLFAIIKAKPIPLCILDEVEAALDEANVIRYAEFLQTLKDKTQFLVITHRHGTMSRVDHLFGATMQKRGVTSFFTVELAKAKELIKEN